MLATAAALTAVLVAAANASAGTVVTIKSGDSALVVGTDLVCAVAPSQGKLAVDCFRANAKGLVANSYALGLRSDSVVVLQHVDAKGNITIVRKLQSAAKTIKLGPTDAFKVAGTDLACTPDGKAITCFHYNGKGAVPNSYGIILTDTYATIARYNAAGKASPVVTKRQGR